MESTHQLVLCTCPTEKIATTLAQEVIQEKLAACVNILPAMTSIYAWKMQIETTPEILLLIKTTKKQYSKLESFLKKRHPYECPEIVAIPIVQGLKGYLQWIDDTLTS